MNFKSRVLVPMLLAVSVFVMSPLVVLGDQVSDGVTFSDFIEGAPSATMPLGGNDLIPVIQNGVTKSFVNKPGVGKSVSVTDFGAIGDGTSHPLSERYSTLAKAQAVCPSASSLSQEIDWCAAQAAINYAEQLVPVPLTNAARGAEIYWPDGYYIHGTSPLSANNVSLYLLGAGPKNTTIQYTGSPGVNFLDFGRNEHLTIIASTSIGAAGIGYVPGNVLTCNGGVRVTTPCRITVSAVDGSGAITGYTLTSSGDYGTPPNSPISMDGGSGTGFQLVAESWTKNSGTLHVSNMQWSNAGLGGIAINAQFNLSTPTLVVDHMHFRPFDTGYFTQIINCLGCSYAVVEHNQAYGVLPGSTDFAYFEDRNNLIGHYSNKFFDNFTNSFINGYHIVNNSDTAQQGPRWQWNDHVKGQRFLYVEAVLAHSPPEYTLLDNEAQIDGYFVDSIGGLQDLKAIGNEIFIGNGGMVSPPSTGGGFNLRGGLGAIIAQNIMNVTQDNVPTVNFLTTDGTRGIVVNNIFRNSGGVMTNGVTLEANSSFWYERGQNAVSNITTSVTDAGSNNDTSLSPKIHSPVITGGTTIAGNLELSSLLKLSADQSAAAAGTDQSTCFPIVTSMAKFTNVAIGTGACLTNFQNNETFVTNAGLHDLLVYPPSGGTINDAATDAPVTVPIGASWRFDKYSGTIIGTDVNLGGTFSTGIKTPKNFIAATNGGTSNLVCNQAAVFTHNAGIAGYTINMPTSPAEGCWISLSTAFSITTLTMSDPGGKPITSALTTITSTTPTAWVYHSNRWYPCVACE